MHFLKVSEDPLCIMNSSTFFLLCTFPASCKHNTTAHFSGIKCPAIKQQDLNCHYFPSTERNIIYAQGIKAKTNYSAHKTLWLFHTPPNYRRHLKSCRDTSPAAQLPLPEIRSGCGQFCSQGIRHGDAAGVGMHSALWNSLHHKSESAAKSQERGREIRERESADASGLRTERSRGK